MGTYIIHFDDKPWEDLDDEQYYCCKEIPWFSTTDTTISRLTPYTEDSAYTHGYTEAEAKYREVRDELEKQAYQQGLSDAWEAARKIANMPYGEEEKVFGSGGWTFIVKHTASEAIEKIRQYEQEKEEIKVGDEIETPSGLKGYVVNFTDDELVHYVSSEGRFGTMGTSAVSKTGRHFPQIAEVLQKMKEADNG